MGYYLVDDIYHSWATFAKVISNPQSNKRTHFIRVQEEVMKGVENEFNVLQARFAILRVRQMIGQ
jgi:hypothetical protein